jgi:hypothetical protein
MSFQVKAYVFIKFMYMYVNGFYVYIHKLLGNITKAYYSKKTGVYIICTYFSIDNAHPKLFWHSFGCIDNAHDAN